MSTNVSLVDTPGVSAYFDGQPIQDQQEAELQREEEREAKELRHLLETELEDFEDDFLSESNSDEDDLGNSTVMSGQHEGDTLHPKGAAASPRGANRPMKKPLHSPSSPLSSARGKSQSIPEGLNMNSDLSSPFRLMDHSKARAVITEHRPDRPDHHGLSASVDSLLHVGLAADSTQRPGFELQSSPHYASNPVNHLHTLAFDGRDSRPSPVNHDRGYINPNFIDGSGSPGAYSNSSVKNRGAHTKHSNADGHMPRNYDKSELNLPSPAQNQTGGLNYNAENIFIDQRQKGDTIESDNGFLNLPGLNQDSERSPPGVSQPWGGNYSNEAYGYSPIDNNNYGGVGNPAPVLSEMGQGFGGVAMASGTHPISTIPEQNSIGPIMTGDGQPPMNISDDEWMFQIQTPTTAAHLYSHHHEHPHHHHQQQQQQQPYPHLMQQHHHHMQQQQQQQQQWHGGGDGYTFPAQSHEMRNKNLPQPEDGFPNPPAQQIRSSTKSPPPPPLPSSSPPPLSTSAVPMAQNKNMNQFTKRENITRKSQEMLDTSDDAYSQYKVHYNKHDAPKGEEEFYLQSDNIEFFRKDGPEERRTYEQLEILYRARGREIEELTRKLEEKEEETGKEMRILKHKLAMANGEVDGTGESLRQCQKLLQQAKSDNADASGKIRALETQVSSLKDAKEELIKKLQTAETTIENLSHHVEELQDSESLSRARNEHDSMVSSLTQRYEKELLAVKEKLDACKAVLESKQEELVYLKKQLADTTHELEQAQISRGETINRLARSLEDSQKQCQALLEHSSSHEISSLKVQLQQSLASKRISEDLCKTFQNEVKELKEQLNMFESASNLGAFTSSSRSHHAPSCDDSMTDLGIRKTLDFDTPQSVARFDGTQTSEELITSLRSELEKCLRSNRQKRAEVAEKAEEIRSLREEAEEAETKIADLERSYSEQKKRLQEIEALTSGSEGVGIIEARLRKDIENLKREKAVLLEDIEDYKKRLEEVGASEAKLTEINAELSHQITQMVNDFDLDKHAALERCQRTMEEVNRLSIENLRQEMEERYRSEKSMISDQYRNEVQSLKQQLSSAQSELDNVKSLYIKTCEESAAQEAELNEKFKKQLEEELEKMKDQLEREKREYESYLKETMEKEWDEKKESPRQGKEEADIRAELEKEIELKVSKARLECLEEQRASRQTVIDEAVSSAKKQWTTEHEKELQSWAEREGKYKEELASRDQEISELKQKLDEGATEGGEKFQRHIEELEVEWKTKLEALEKQHTEEVNALVAKFDKEKGEIEQRLSDMSKRLSGKSEKNEKELDRGDSALEGDSDSKDVTGMIERSEGEPKEGENELKLEEQEKANTVAEMIRTLETKVQEKEAEIRDLEIKLQEKEIGDAEKSENKNSEMQQAELSEYKQKISELEERLQVAESSYITSKMRLDDDRESSIDDVLLGDVDKENMEKNPEKMKEYLEKLESCLKSVKQKYEREISEIKQQHKKEFEKAARTREEKFQNELRYFLKEREDRGKAKLEKAVKDCEIKAKRELEKVLRENDEKHKLELQRTIQEFEEKGKDELRKAVEECEKRVREELRLNDSRKEESIKMNEALNIRMESEKELRKKYEHEMDELKKQHSAEKFSLEKKIKELEEEKDNEIVNLSLRHEEEERKLKNEFDMELKKVKEEYQKETERVRQELDEKQKADTTITKNLFDTMERESEIEKEVAERVKKEVDGVKTKIVEEEVGKRVTERMQEERSKWLREAQEYISSEIKQGVEDRLKEEQEKAKKDQEMNEEKLKKDKDEEVKVKVKEKLEVEMANLKKKFVSELEARVMKEKSRLEQEVKTWKEEVTKKMEENKEEMVKRLRSDLENKLVEERRKMEREVKRVKDEVTRVKEEEMKEIREEMEGEMRKRIQRERKEWEEETDHKRAEKDGTDNERQIGWKERLQSEVEARTKACSERDKAVEFIKSREVMFREEKQKLIAGLKKCREDLDAMKKEHIALEEKYTEMDRRYKTDMKEARRARDQDLSELRSKCEEENESLVAAFKGRIRDLEEKYTSEIERVKKEAEMEKAGLLVEVRKQAEQVLTTSPVQIPDSESSTILELRDQYLDTVSKIKADVMAHVQEANVRAAATMKAEIRKQRVKIIEIFKTKCKASIRSVLTGQVPLTSITALEHTIDMLSENLVSTPTTGTQSTTSTPRSNNSSGGRKITSGDVDVAAENINKSPVKASLGEENRESEEVFLRESKSLKKKAKHESRRESPKVSPRSYDRNEFDKAKGRRDLLPESDSEYPVQDGRSNHHHHHHQNIPEQEGQHQPLQQQQQQQPHPQLEKVDLFDTDLFHRTPTSSNDSSPAQVTRTLSRINPAVKAHINMPDIPVLNLSPNVTTRPKPTASKMKEIGEEPRDFPKGSSPRDDMKVIEARVRLANWARSGEMPWKPSTEKPEGDPALSLFTKEPEHRHRRDDSPASDNARELRDKFSQPQKLDKTAHHKSEGKNIDSDGFVKPGSEAEQWVGMQREKTGTVSKVENHPQRGKAFDYNSDDSAASTASNASFVTLEPEMTESAGSKFVSLGMDSGFPASSKNTNDRYSPQKGSNHDTEPRRNGGNLYGGERGDKYESKKDYERIKAAVLGDPRGTMEHPSHATAGHFQENSSDDDRGHGKPTPHVPREFGSVESLSSEGSDNFPDQRNARDYSEGRSAIPTSTPLVKGSKMTDGLRARSEGNTFGNSSRQWKKVGGTSFFTSQREHADQQNNTDEEFWQTGRAFRMGADVQQSTSLPKKSSRSRSAEREGGDLVLRSAEFQFPSDISRITQGSGSEQQSLWRYKSLEDLIPKAKRSGGEMDEMRDVRLRVDERIDRGMKDVYSDERDGMDRRHKGEKANQGRDYGHKQFDSVNERNRMQAPVQAMTSEFWEQQSEEDDTDNERHVHWYETGTYDQREAKLERGKERVRGGGDAVNVKKSFDPRVAPRSRSPGNFLTSKSRRRSSERNEKYDRDFERGASHIHHGSRSEPRHSRHKNTSPAREDEIGGRQRSRNDTMRHKGGNSFSRIPEEKRLPSDHHVGDASSLFMDEVSDMRRSLEELKPSYYFGHIPPPRGLGKSKMMRSTSEQSLHTVHFDKDHWRGQGHGLNPYDDIDALVSASQFDLRPFSMDEQF